MAEAVTVTTTTMNICEGECGCCIDRIYSALNKNEKEWEEMERKKLAETPLHVAAAAGNTAVAVEILKLMPCLGRKLNPEGLSPLHVAINAKQTSTAQALASFEKQLVQVKGKGGVTPLMQCAAVGDCFLLASLLVECPNSVADVNNKSQTAVHVAAEYGQCDAICVLVDWLRRTDQIASVLTIKDAKGNTALHAAAKSGCLKGARRLVGLVKLNRRNSEGKTALDVAKDNNKTEVAHLLESRGARRDSELSPSNTVVDYVLTEPNPAEAISRAYYYLTQELTLEMRSAVLVVAALIIAATYQVVLQPPAGVYPPPEGVNKSSEEATPPPHLAGQMVMRFAQYRYFMPLNTFAFALSAVIMIFVVPGSPIFLILHFCLVFMCLSYLLALDAISYYTGISNMVYFMALYAVFGAFLVKLFYYPIKALLVEEDWWLRRFSIKCSNLWARVGQHHLRYDGTNTMSIVYRVKKQHSVLYRK